jgi:hypothetical protein
VGYFMPPIVHCPVSPTLQLSILLAKSADNTNSPFYPFLLLVIFVREAHKHFPKSPTQNMALLKRELVWVQA